MLHQSTSTGRASISKDSLYRKAKKGTQKLLKYMGDWVRICKDPNTRPGEFTPAAPPSGVDRDEVWTKIKSSEHRSQQCLTIFTARSRNQHLAENSAEAIREALLHLNFARRGYSLEEELEFRSKHEAHRLDDDEEAVYGQIIENVDAGHVVAESDDDDDAPSQVRPQSATAPAPRGYFEAPYCQIQGSYHPYELAAKAFTQYAGSGHQDISAFFTSEWAEQRRTQASLGATGRAQQRRQHLLDLNSSQQSQHAASSTTASSQSSTESFSSASTHQMDDLTKQMQQSNSHTQHNRVTTSMEKAIELAKALRKPTAEVRGLQQRFYEFLLDDINTHAPAAVPNQSQLASVEPPQSQRRRVSLGHAAAIQLLQNFGEVVDNRGQGDCMFHCFATIEEEYLTVRCKRRPRDAVTHTDLRAQVVATLRADSDIVQVAAVADGAAYSSIYCSEDMIQQKNSVDEYCNWMALDGSPGRSVMRLRSCTAVFFAVCFGA